MAAFQNLKSSQMSGDQPGDSEVNARARATSQRGLENFEVFFEAHWPRILSILDRLVGDADEAEDLALEAFEKLYEARERLGAEDNPGGWLYRAAMNLGLNALRSRYRRTWYERLAGRYTLEQATPLDPTSAAEASEEHRQVQWVLAELKPRSARLLVLHSAGLSYQELADALQVGVSSIGSLLNRAEKEFEKKYRNIYGNRE